MQRFALLAVLLGGAATAQQTLVVPSANAVVDGNSRSWVGGTIQPRRQLTLIDGSMLAPLANHAITGLSFRRNVEAEAFTGGGATLTVKLSHAATTAANPDARFANNHGNDLTTVFHGAVTLPNSPTPAGTSVAWTPDNTLQIAFQTPFAYQGGTLALEISGTPDSQGAAEWWPADAVWEQGSGFAQNVGSGCGPYGGANSEWSFVTGANFVPGGTVAFQALGEPGRLAFWVLAVAAQPQALDLTTFGAPGCFLHLQLPMGSLLTFFGPPLIPQRPNDGGLAVMEFKLPSDPGLLGVSLGSQWLGIGSNGLISSNANQWSISATQPSLPMTLVTASASLGEPATGTVIPAKGHVLRFEYQ